MNSFIKEYTAKIKGDNVAADAEKAFRQANAGLKSQISSLKGDSEDFKQNIEDAKDELVSKRINEGKPITNRDLYVEALLLAKNKITMAEAVLKQHLETIAFLNDELKNLNTEVKD